jgi:hypothetical protein
MSAPRRRFVFFAAQGAQPPRAGPRASAALYLISGGAVRVKREARPGRRPKNQRISFKGDCMFGPSWRHPAVGHTPPAAGCWLNDWLGHSALGLPAATAGQPHIHRLAEQVAS